MFVPGEGQRFIVETFKVAAQNSVSICLLCQPPIGFDDDMVTKLGEKDETLGEMVIRTKHKHNVLTKNDTTVEEE